MNTPNDFLELVDQCQKHGIAFSQGEKCVYVSHVVFKNKRGWKISDHYGRKVFSSIFYDEIEKAYFVIDKDNNILRYNQQEDVKKHAAQFFMKDVHKNLTTLN